MKRRRETPLTEAHAEALRRALRQLRGTKGREPLGAYLARAAAENA